MGRYVTCINSEGELGFAKFSKDYEGKCSSYKYAFAVQSSEISRIYHDYKIGEYKEQKRMIGGDILRLKKSDIPALNNILENIEKNNPIIFVTLRLDLSQIGDLNEESPKGEYPIYKEKIIHFYNLVGWVLDCVKNCKTKKCIFEGEW
jgi:hypothetical protein